MGPRNARAWERGLDEGLRNLLHHIREGRVADALTAEIDEAVSVVNDNPARREVIVGYITLEQTMQVHERAACKEARAEGEARHAAPVGHLLDEGRIDDLRHPTADPTSLEALYAEYGL